MHVVGGIKDVAYDVKVCCMSMIAPWEMHESVWNAPTKGQVYQIKCEMVLNCNKRMYVRVAFL